MKAVILAGGLGTRMGDCCNNIPKPMLPVAGKPVLEHQLEALKKEGVTEFIFVTGYLGEKIQEYLDNFTKSNNFGICVMIFSVVDGSGSYLISSGSALFIADAAFADIGEHCDGYLFLKEVMSRKKQIVPLLTEAAKNYRSNYHS